MSDTSHDIEERLIRMMIAKSPAERLRMASSMFETGKRLIVAGLLKENPSLNNAQIRARTFLRLYSDIFTSEEIKVIVQGIPNMQLDADCL